MTASLVPAPLRHPGVDALLGPTAETRDHPVVLRAQELAAGLAVDAERVDVEGVTRARVQPLLDAGLLGLGTAVEAGGGGAPPTVVRAVTESLAGACGATWFVVAQHTFPLAAVLSGDEGLRARVLPGLVAGEVLAGVAVSHLRRPGRPAVTARPDGGGWVVDGTVGWMTAWGIADVMLLGAVTPDDRVLMALVPAREADGLVAAPLMSLAAMEGAATTQLELDGYRVPDDTEVATPERGLWLAVDAAKTANVTPAVFGLLRSICARLALWGERQPGIVGGSGGTDLALALATEGAAVRAEAYRLMDEVPTPDAVEERLALRAHALELTTRAACALVAAGAGASMARTHPHQRMAREALFHLIQAQTAPSRAATLERFAAVATP